jgi:hypothetical protein
MATPTKAEIAAHLFMGVRTLRRLQEEGKLPRTATIDEYRERHISNLREQAAGRSGKSGEDLAGERARLAIVQRERAQLELSIRRNETIEQRFILPIVEAAFEAQRERFNSMPGKLSDPLANQPREFVYEWLKAEIDEIFAATFAVSEIAQAARDAQMKGWQ